MQRKRISSKCDDAVKRWWEAPTRVSCNILVDYRLWLTVSSRTSTVDRNRQTSFPHFDSRFDVPLCIFLAQPKTKCKTKSTWRHDTHETKFQMSSCLYPTPPACICERRRTDGLLGQMETFEENHVSKLHFNFLASFLSKPYHTIS